MSCACRSGCQPSRVLGLVLAARWALVLVEQRHLSQKVSSKYLQLQRLSIQSVFILLCTNKQRQVSVWFVFLLLLYLVMVLLFWMLGLLFCLRINSLFLVDINISDDRRVSCIGFVIGSLMFQPRSLLIPSSITSSY